MRIVTTGLLWLLICFFCSGAVSVATLNQDAPDIADTPVMSTGPMTPPPAGPASPKGPDSAEAMTDIVDIRPLEDIGFDTRIIRYTLYAVCAVLLILVLFYLIDRLIRKKRKKPGEGVMLVLPDQLALKRLEDLGLLDNKEEKEFYFRLTAIVRDYIQGQFSLDAPEMTTEELLPAIPALPIDRGLASGLKDLLRSTDPVKFAGVPVTQEKMREDMTFARHFVESTRNVPDDSDKAGGE